MSDGSVRSERLEIKIVPRGASVGLGVLLGEIRWLGELQLPVFRATEEHPFEVFDRMGSLRLIDVPYVSERGETFHPLLYRAAAEYLSTKEPKSPLDFMVLMEIQCRGVMPLTAVATYVQAVLRSKERPTTDARARLFSEFVRAMMTPFVEYAVGATPKSSDAQRSRRRFEPVVLVD